MKILNETTFMRALGEMASDLLRDTVDSTRPRIGHFTRSFTNQEEYLRTCLISAGMVNIACDQLNYALAYLSGYKPRKTFDGELITRADHIAFQIENIYLRLGMVPDRSLRLTNEVFRLGLPSRECGMRTVTDNQHLKGTPVRASLQTIDKIVRPHREIRNIIAHLSRYNDPELSKVEPFFILQKLEGSHDESVLEHARNSYKLKTDAYIEVIRKEFGPIVSNLIAEVGRLFDTLLPPFRREHSALR